MTQLLQVVQKLTEQELREVQDFAEFLLARRKHDGAEAPARAEPQPFRYGRWFGSLAHVHPEMPDAEFKNLIREEWVRTAED